jgi:tetratricopeptide (TPR) repeat protein
MTPLWTRALVAAALLGGGVAAAVWLSAGGPPPAAADGTAVADDAPPIPVRPDSEAPYEPNKYQLTTDQSVRVFEDRVRADPNHLNLTNLAGLYVRLARETGDHAAYDKADAALRRALQVFPPHTPAKVGLALVTCARHKFAEGLKLAEEVYKDDPDALDALSVIADAHLELGNYPEAEAALGELEKKGPKPAPPEVLARSARLAELTGDPDRAINLLRQAAAGQKELHDFKEAGAWYAMRLGEVLFSVGRLDEAAAQFEAALADHPKYPAALSLLGRVRAAQGRPAEAKDLLYRAARITPDVATLAALAELHAAAGEEFPAKAQADAIEATDKEPVAVRDLVLYYCATGRKLPRALELAGAEARTRKDVYTWDTLAWARYKNGRLPEAEQAAAQALRLGTKDAVLYYHAGRIAHARGKPDQARDHLRTALAINPHFSARGAADARRVLAELPPGR